MDRTEGDGRSRDPIQVLHEVAFDLQTADTGAEVCQGTVEAAETILEFDTCMITLAEGGKLRVRARSTELPADGVAETREFDEGIAGRTYRTGESYRFDDLSSVDGADPSAAYRSGLSVPVGDRGVFQAASERPEFFSADDLEVVELLTTHTANALERLEYERELEQFTSIVSHDLRNPLNVARGYLELLRDEPEAGHVAEIDRSLERMETLIEELLTLAHGGAIVESPEPVSVPAAAEAAWETVETADASLTRAFAEPVTVEADRVRLIQLLENLFRNSVEHGVDDAADGTGVEVTVGPLPAGFYVEDDGAGIDPDARSAVFEKGYTSQDAGTGLGLHIVRRIAHAHGWTVSITTSASGGARFELTDVDVQSG